MIALDVDGTLLTTDKRLTRKTAHIIRAAMARGVHVVLASARPPRSVKAIYEHLKLDTPQINYNGALIHDPRRRRPLFHQPMTAQLTRKLIDHARKVLPEVVVSIEILDKWYTDHFDETLPTETSKSFMPDFIGPLDAIVRTPVTKLMFLARPTALAKVHTAIRAKFAGQIAVAVSDKHLIQVMHPKADKGAALAKVSHQYGVSRQQVLAVGDAPNDLGMLRWAGVAVAMENAWPQVRAAAHAVVPSNDNDGVAIAIERFVLANSAAR